MNPQSPRTGTSQVKKVVKKLPKSPEKVVVTGQT